MSSDTPLRVPRTAVGAVLLGSVFLLPLPPQEEPLGWPREIDTPNHTVVLFQPQIESFEGNDLTSRSAFSVTAKTGSSAPTFGVAWMTARVETDRDTRMVDVLDVTVDNVRFPDITEEQEGQLAALFERELPTWDLSVSLDRLLTALDLVEREQAVADALNMDPPVVLFRDEPAVLVTIDGDPILTELDGSSLERVVNTAFTVISEPASGAYYLFAGEDSWYTAPGLEGPWELTENVPPEVERLTPPPEEEAGDVEEPEEEDEAEPGPPPGIVVAMEPTELIVTQGAPEYAPIASTDLLYVTNSESDVVLEVSTQRHYVILSGRWFTSTSLEGPWEHVPPEELAETFKNIPPESEMGHLLVSVPGTEAATEAALDNQIPQTAAVRRADTTLEVEYDGEPIFEPIEGTSLSHAVNTSYQVLRSGDRYFACHEAVWFVADSPHGPWEVTDYIPADVSLIPPESPVYNVKYVYVYDSTPEVVYVGYTPGYTYSYVYHGTVVWGTGFWYRPWYRTVFIARPVTWGWHVRWNPWWGWGFGFSYSTGPFTFHIGFGSPWHRGGWWGPVGFRSYRVGFHRGWHAGYRTGARAGFRAGWHAGNRNARVNNIYNRPQNRARNLPSTSNIQRAQPARAGTRPNNVFSDRSGNVYRQNQGQWQQRNQGNWQSNRSGNVQNLDRAAQARNRGAARTQNFQRSGAAAARAPRRR